MESEHLIQHVFTASQDLVEEADDFVSEWKKYMKKQKLFPHHEVIQATVNCTTLEVKLLMWPQAWYHQRKKQDPGRVTHLSSDICLFDQEPQSCDYKFLATHTCPTPLLASEPLVPKDFLKDMSKQGVCGYCYVKVADDCVSFHFYSRHAETGTALFVSSLCSNMLGHVHLQYSQLEFLVGRCLQLLEDNAQDTAYQRKLTLSKCLPMPFLVFCLLSKMPGAEKWTEGDLQDIRQLKGEYKESSGVARVSDLLAELAGTVAGLRLLLDIFTCLHASPALLRYLAFVLHCLVTGRDRHDIANEADFFRTKVQGYFTPQLGLHATSFQ